MHVEMETGDTGNNAFDSLFPVPFGKNFPCNHYNRIAKVGFIIY